MKVLSGDWPAETLVMYKTSFTNKPTAIVFAVGVFSHEAIPMDEIKSAKIVDSDKRMSVGSKIGWGLAGGVLLGPVGIAIGGIAGGNKHENVVAVIFKDGRRALIRGNARKMEPILSSGYQWEDDAVTHSNTGEPEKFEPDFQEDKRNEEIQVQRELSSSHQSDTPKPSSPPSRTFGKRIRIQ